MTGYVRQSSYNDNDTITSAHSNDEFNALVIAMALGTGHKHDGTSDEGAYVPLISNVGNTRKVEVTASGALTTGDHQVTGQIVGDTSISSGTSITAGSTVTAGTGLTVTSGDLAVSAGDITLSGTVDGRDVAADGTKLDSIESGSTADQTGAEIKALYEAEADTNAFTDAEQSKLSGIEDGATADQTASEILTAIKTVDGTGSGLDADTVDGTELAAITHSGDAVSLTGAVVGSTTVSSDGSISIATTATSDPTLTIDGDITGSATFTDLGNATLTATAAANIPQAGVDGFIDDDWLSYTIPALSAQYPGLDVVDVVYYDTSKDSDGGAWTKKTDSLSYGKEDVPSGRYLGQFSEATAATAAGGVAGDWFRHTTGNSFNVLTGPNIGTPIYRAGSATFPTQALIVAEDDRVIIFDASGPELTMWMVFVGGAHNYLYSSPITGIAMAEGQLLASESSAVGGVCWVDFPSDRSVGSIIQQGNTLHINLPISMRNNGGASNRVTAPNTYPIVSRDVNDVAVTVLDTAPTDPLTGLKVPTIAVATEGGVSVIKDDGSVVDSSTTSAQSNVSFNNTDKLTYSFKNSSVRNVIVDSALADGFTGYVIYTDSSIPPLLSGTGVGYKLAGDALSSFEGLSILHENPTTPTEGMVAHITDEYNTGWMVGNTQLAALCDTETGSITETELVTNGTFDADLTGWTDNSTGDGYIVWDASGGIEVYRGADSSHLGRPSQSVNTIPSKTYKASFEVKSGTGAVTLRIGNTAIGNEVAESEVIGTAGTYTLTFTAQNAQTYVSLRPNTNDAGIVCDNISVKEVVPDRSGNDNHLDLVGTLNRTAIGDGEIAAWSGFDGSNYLTATVPTGGVLYGWEEQSGIWTLCESESDFTSASEVAGTLTIDGGDKIILPRYSLTTPTADQFAKMYRDELAMIQGGAVLDGADPDIKALAYDDSRDLLHAASAGVVSSFRGLERVSSQVTSVGTNSSLAAQDGSLFISGSTGFDADIPAVSIRERLAQALHNPPSEFDTVFSVEDGDLLLENKYSGDLVLNSVTGDVTVSGDRVLTVADEGTGNGLDADTVDGIEAALLVKQESSTSAMQVPTGTTAQRPVSPSVGDWRENTTEGNAERWNGSAWLGIGGGSIINMQVLTASGTFTPTVGATKFHVFCTGAGGGSGGADGTDGDSAVSGGSSGAGGTSEKLFTSAQLGANAAVTIGAGGTGGAAGANNGSAGGSSTFTPAGTGGVLTGSGGNFGSGTSSSTNDVGSPGAGGAASGGDINHQGGGGNPGAATSTGNSWATSGVGGSSLWGSGGDGRSTDGDGNNAINFGSGASGGTETNNSGDAAGANGADGVVVVYEYA